LVATSAAAEIDRITLDRILSETVPRDAEACRVLADSLSPHLVEAQAAGHDSLATEIADRLGLAAFRQGDSPSAIERWAVGLEHARATGDPDMVARLLQSSSNGYGSAARYDDALVLLHELIQNRRVADDRPGLARGWSTLAACYNMMGRYPEAFAVNDSSIALTRGTSARETLGGAFARQASLLNYSGKFAEALALSDSALAIAEARDLPRLIQRAARDRAAILIGLNRHDDALEAARRSVRVADSLGDPMTLFFARIRVAEVLHALGRSSEVVGHIDAMVGSVPPAVWERVAVQLGTIRASAYVGLGRYAEADSILQGAIAAFRAKWEGASDADERVGYFQIAGAVFPVLASSALAQGRIEDAWLALETGTGMTLRHHATGEADPRSLDSLRIRLAEHRAALFQWADASWVEIPGVVVTGGAVHPAAVESGRIDDAIEQLQRLVVEGEPMSRLVPTLRDIADVVLAPHVRALSPDTERLVIVLPTGWSDVPLELLPLRWKGEATTLGEAFAVSYLPCASAMLFLEEKEPGGEPMVVFADPTFDAAPETAESFTVRGFEPEPLPEARHEAREVAARRAKVWIGEDASADAFRSAPVSAASVLHFATHVVVWPFDPSRNTMFLAGADGDVRASDIEARTLHADLVTLSGCRTATGHAYRGEGAVGLERSFFMAGSRSVVASRWDVGDRASRVFMGAFYAALEGGISRDDAMRGARRRLAAAGYPPRDYVAFRLSGLGHLPVPALVSDSDRDRRSVAAAAAVVAILALVLAARRRRSTPPIHDA
jgi:CHAT domain-containing protein